MYLATTVSNGVDVEVLGLRKLIKNTSYILARQLISGLLQLVIVAIIAREYGSEGNGIFAVALLLPSMLTAFLNLGIGPANVYYLGSAQFSPKKVFQASARLALVLSLFGLAIGGAILQLGANKVFPGIQQQVLWLALITFPLSLMQSLISSIFQGMQEFREFNRVLILQPVVMLVFVIALMIFEVHSIYYLMLGNFLVVLITLVLSIFFLKKFLHNDEESSSEPYVKEALKYGYKAHLSNILAFVNYKADIFLVNFLISPAAAGVYVIAVKLSERLWVLSQAVSTVLLPRLSELSNDERKRLQITPLISRVTLWLTAFASIALAFVAFPLIKFVFGSEYLDAYIPLLILLPGIVFTSASRVLANDLAARGRPELNMYTSWVVVVCNIFGNILLIPMYGLLGAAVATTLAYVLNFCMRLLMYRHITSVSILSLVVIRYSDVRGFFSLFTKIRSNERS